MYQYYLANAAALSQENASYLLAGIAAVLVIVFFLAAVSLSRTGKILGLLNKKPSVSVPAAPVVEAGIDEETVAAITAAIVAYEQETGKTMRIRSIQRTQRPAWAAAGIAENTRPF